MILLTDRHIHLDLMKDGLSFARNINSSLLRIWNMTVNAEQFITSSKLYDDFEGIEVALGLHPQFECNIESFLELLPKARIVGEIGLDFSHRAVVDKKEQLENFKRICAACSKAEHKILSVHAISSATKAIEILKEEGTFYTCNVIFHMFSGSSTDLKEAIDAGADFSINERMLNSKRGREYVKAIPKNRICFETDYPKQIGNSVSPYDVYESLNRCMLELKNIKHSSKL